eukprot:gene15122-biopygen1480
MFQSHFGISQEQPIGPASRLEKVPTARELRASRRAAKTSSQGISTDEINQEALRIAEEASRAFEATLTPARTKALARRATGEASSSSLCSTKGIGDQPTQAAGATPTGAQEESANSAADTFSRLSGNPQLEDWLSVKPTDLTDSGSSFSPVTSSSAGGEGTVHAAVTAAEEREKYRASPEPTSGTVQPDLGLSAALDDPQQADSSLRQPVESTQQLPEDSAEHSKQTVSATDPRLPSQPKFPFGRFEQLGSGNTVAAKDTEDPEDPPPPVHPAATAAPTTVTAAAGRGLLCSAMMMIERLLIRTKRHCIGETDVYDLLEKLQDLFLAADMGWYMRPEIPQAAVDKVKKRRPAGVAIDEILQQLLDDKVVPVYQLALKENSAVRDEAHLQDIVDNLIRNPAIGAVSTTAGGGTVLGTVGSSAAFLRIRVRGRLITPDAVLMEVFWELLSIIYAASDNAERDFYAMGCSGKQGKLDLRAFAEEVQHMYSCVRHISSINIEQLPVVFYRGLNSAETIRYAKEQMGKDRRMKLDDLVDVLEEYERHSFVEDTVENKTARLLPASVRSTTRSGGSKKVGFALSDDQDAGSLTKGELLKRNRSGQLQKLQRDNPSDYYHIMQAFDMLEKFPGHPGAICLECPKGPLHTNSACEERRKARDLAAFANAAEQTTRFSPGSSSSGGGKGSTSGGQQTESGGLFRGVPKPESNRSRGQRSFGYQQDRSPSWQSGRFDGSSNGRCSFCGFPEGHESGICYYKEPRAAGPRWPGPSDRTSADLVLAYLERCADQQVQPRIRRCTETVEHLRVTGRFTPAIWNMLSPGQGGNQPRRPAAPPTAAAAVEDDPWRMSRDPVLPDQPWEREAPVAPAGRGGPGAASGPSRPAYRRGDHTASAAIIDEDDASATEGGNAPGGLYYSVATAYSQDKLLEEDAGVQPEDIEGASAVAAAATRSSTRQRSDAVKRVSEKPKSFLPVQPVLYDDATGDGPAAVQLHPAQEEICRQIRAVMEGREQEATLSGDNTADEQEEGALAAAASCQPDAPAEVQSAGKLKDRRPATIMVNTRISSSQTIKMPLELTFQPPEMDYVLQQSRRQGLDRLCCHSKSTGLTLITSDGREILLDGVFVDSGANVLLITEAFCKEIGLFFRRCDQVPGVRGYGGSQEKRLIGVTNPFKLVLALGCSFATTLHVKRGFVVPGDAAGMYSICLDKQTLFPVYRHVNPRWQHLCWLPRVAMGNSLLVAGIPITSTIEQLEIPMAPLAAVDMDDCYACLVAAQQEADDLEQQLRVLEHAELGDENEMPGLVDVDLMEILQRERAQGLRLPFELAAGPVAQPQLAAAAAVPPQLEAAADMPAAADSDDEMPEMLDAPAAQSQQQPAEADPRLLMPTEEIWQQALQLNPAKVEHARQGIWYLGHWEEADGDASKSWYKPGPDVLTQLHPAGEPEQPHDAAWTVHPTGKWILGNHPEATAEQMARMVQMLERSKEAFAYSLSEVPGYSGDPVDFTLIDSSQRMLASQRQYTEEELKFGDEKMQEMLEAGIVVEISTTNPVASCITLPMKRAPDGSWTDKRFCIDLRAVNSNTVVDKFGLPLPEVLFRKMAGAKFLTKIDLRSGFWQLRLSEAGGILRVMETELAAAGIQRGVAFVDDVSVWDDNFEEHIEQVDRLLQRFIAVRLRAHPSKTVVAAEKLGYLGHLVSASVCQPEEAKVAQPLYQLLKKDVPFVWSAACQEAYDKLKAALCTPGLALRQPVPDRPFHLYVDWSQSGIKKKEVTWYGDRQHQAACGPTTGQQQSE